MFTSVGAGSVDAMTDAMNNDSTDAVTDPSPGGNATAFLGAFNDIEAHLRRDLRAKPSDGFKWMVNLSHRKHRLSDAQRSALMAFSDLRNAISHGEYRNGRPIADPLPETVADVLEWAGSRDMPYFMPRTVTVQDAVTALTIPGDDGLVPRALIITEHGRPDQKPLRVVGGADLPTLWAEVQLGSY